MRPEYKVRNTYVGDGSTSQFQFDFKIVNKEHLLVLHLDDEGEIVWQTRANDTTYFTTTLQTGQNPQGGSITLLAALAIDHTLMLLLADDLPTQPSKYIADNRMTMTKLEASLDTLSGQIQRIRYLVDRSFKYPEKISGDIVAEVELVDESVLVFNYDSVTDTWTPTTVPRSEFVGDKGDQGDAGTIQVGDVEELEPGEAPYVTNVGDINDAVFDFGIPGASQVAIGTVTEIANDSPTPMSVTNVGTVYKAILDFVLRAGPRGEAGESTALITVNNTLPNDAIGSNGDVWLYISNGNPASGNLYQKVSGTYVLKGNITGPPGGVNSFNTRTGNVVSQSGDYTANQVTFDNTVKNVLTAITVQSAIDELTDALQDTVTDIDNLQSDVAMQQVAIEDLQDNKEPLIANGTNGYIWTMVGGVKTWAAPAAASPLTTKGDIYGHNGTTGVRIPVGTTDYIFTADPTSPTGVAWKAAPISLPSQTGNAGKILETDGTNAAWVDKPKTVVSGTQTLANAAVITRTGGRVERVKVQSNADNTVAAVTIGTSPAPQDGDQFFIQGMNDLRPVSVGPFENLTAGQVGHLIYDLATTSWIKVGGV